MKLLIGAKWLIIGACVLLLMAGCSYSARTEMSILHVGPDRGLAEAETLVNDLMRHHDGCFSGRNATLTRTASGDMVTYDFLMRDHGIQLRLTVNGLTGEIALALDEWSESRYSKEGAACYRQVVRALLSRYESDQFSVIERCKGPCAR